MHNANRDQLMAPFSAALNLVTGHDVELEGTVLYRLARFHSKVSKLHAV